jgi:inner membrane transporter RhtA
MSITEQRRLTGIALMTGSAASNQLGAATAALAFPALGPAGVVAVRQWVAGIVLLATVRPNFASFTRRQWRPVLALALIFAVMNLSLYSAIDRIGLGLAVTLEFLGPLSVALLASRRAIDLGCALIAGAAVVVLARPQPSTDYAGILLALLAAACWAGYVLVNRVVGDRLPGAQGPAAAAGLSALLYIPVGVWALSGHTVTGAALGRAATAGILCSAVPMIADLQALRRVPARFFGVFMSVNPVFAALTGLIVLGQSLAPADWLAIAVIVTVNAVSAGGRATQSEPRSSAGATTMRPDSSRRSSRRCRDHGREQPRFDVVAVAGDLDPGRDRGFARQPLDVNPNGFSRVDDREFGQGLLVEAALGESVAQLRVGEEPGSAVGVVDDGKLEPVGVGRLDLVQVADPGDVLDDGRGDAPADIAPDDGVSELEPEDAGRVNPGVNAGDDVYLPVGDEGDGGHPALQIRPGEGLVPFQ